MKNPHRPRFPRHSETRLRRKRLHSLDERYRAHGNPDARPSGVVATLRARCFLVARCRHCFGCRRIGFQCSLPRRFFIPTAAVGFCRFAMLREATAGIGGKIRGMCRACRMLHRAHKIERTFYPQARQSIFRHTHTAFPTATLRPKSISLLTASHR